MSGGDPLSINAPCTFPQMSYFDRWGKLFCEVWEQHVNNVLKFIPGFSGFYHIDAAGEKQLELALSERLFSRADDVLSSDDSGGLVSFSSDTIRSFVHFAVRGFLRGDSYNVMTEFLGRAEGSFGIQAHCTLETGVVVISSSGQPMSLSYDPNLTLCLFGSEASAVAVPVDSTGTWLSDRLDLDSKGEITRIGRPRHLLEGSFKYSTSRQNNDSDTFSLLEPLNSVVRSNYRVPGLWLHNGVQILSYSLVEAREFEAMELLNRACSIDAAPIPYDPTVDLVGGDLAMTPAIIQAIETGILSICVA